MAVPRKVARLLVVALILGGLIHLVIAGGLLRQRKYALTDSMAESSEQLDLLKQPQEEDNQISLEPQAPVGLPKLADEKLNEKDEEKAKQKEKEAEKEKEKDKEDKDMTSEHRLYSHAFQAFYDQRPQKLDIPKFDKYGGQGSINEEKLKKHRLTDARLREFLQINPKHVKQMTGLHKGLIGEIDKVMEEFPNLSDIYKGAGIAVVAGGRFMPVVTNSLRMLRRTGCKLPVEVFLANKEEYEEQVCEEIFPQLNAKCRVLPEVLGKKAMEHFIFRGYQYKVLSALASSFEHVLLLDADNIPIKDPTDVFSSEVYREYGYILWPDFWDRSTHPDFFTIAGKALGDARDDVKPKKGEEKDPYQGPLLADRVGSMANPSTESGQVFINKIAKFKSLLLATYYNLNGPNYFYPLFSQGMMGQGDKETFLAAAVVLDEPVYQVPRHVQAIGYWYDGSFRGTAMLQFDPTKTYELFGSAARGEIDEKTRDRLVEKEGMFMHSNFPKMNPYSLLKGKQLRTKDGKRFRAYGSPEQVGQFVSNRDIELEIWQESQWMSCSKIRFANWKDVDLDQLCANVTEQVDFMVSTSSGYKLE